MSTKSEREQNRSVVMGRVWGEYNGDTGTATGFTAAPLGPSVSCGTAGDVTRKSQWNDVPTWSCGSAAVVCFSY